MSWNGQSYFCSSALFCTLYLDNNAVQYSPLSFRTFGLLFLGFIIPYWVLGCYYFSVVTYLILKLIFHELSQFGTLAQYTI